MPGYKQVAQLVRNGKSPSEIICTLGIYPSRIGQILQGPRFKRLLQSSFAAVGERRLPRRSDAFPRSRAFLSRTVSGELRLGKPSRRRVSALAAAGDAVNQLAKLAMSDNEKISLQATLTILSGLGSSRRFPRERIPNPLQTTQEPSKTR